MLRILAVLLCVCLSGCASLAGNALYTYKRTGLHECTLTVDSGRQLPGGYTVNIGGDCSVTGVVPVANQGGAALTIDQLLSAAQLLGALKQPISAPSAPAETVSKPQ